MGLTKPVANWECYHLSDTTYLNSSLNSWFVTWLKFQMFLNTSKPPIDSFHRQIWTCVCVFRCRPWSSLHLAILRTHSISTTILIYCLNYSFAPYVYSDELDHVPRIRVNNLFSIRICDVCFPCLCHFLSIQVKAFFCTYRNRIHDLRSLALVYIVLCAQRVMSISFFPLDYITMSW